MAVQNRTAFVQVPRLNELESRGDLAEMSPEDYRTAWAWVHFMFHGPRVAHAELVQYLADIKAERPTPPLGIRLERNLPNLNQQFLAHFRNWQRK